MIEEMEKQVIESDETEELVSEEVTSPAEDSPAEGSGGADDATGDEADDTVEVPEDTVEVPEDTADEPEDAGDVLEDTTLEDAGDEPEDAGDEPDDTVDAVQEPVVVLEEDGRAWFVVHCYSGYENKVRHSIEQRIETMGMQDKIFDVVVPTEEEIEIKDGKRRTVERRVFPGYILVQLIMDEDSWYVVRNTPGVTGFVGMGNDPTPLRPDEVAKIMNRMEAEAPKVKFNFQPGEKVRIRSGPFSDFIGTVDEIDIERAKVKVLVSFFGRETPVELDFLHVENV